MVPKPETAKMSLQKTWKTKSRNWEWKLRIASLTEFNVGGPTDRDGNLLKDRLILMIVKFDKELEIVRWEAWERIRLN